MTLAFDQSALNSYENIKLDADYYHTTIKKSHSKRFREIATITDVTDTGNAKMTTRKHMAM